MEAKLVIIGADIKPGEYKLKLPTIIGRSKDATLKLVHPLVSRQHCEIFETEGVLHVRDLGSLNGTFVNGERVEESELLPGGTVTIGTVTFRAEYESDAELLPPTAGKSVDLLPGLHETVAPGGTEETWMSDAPAHAAGQEADDEFSLDWLGDDEEGSPEASATSEDEPPDDFEVDDDHAAATSDTSVAEEDLVFDEPPDEPHVDGSGHHDSESGQHGPTIRKRIPKTWIRSFKDWNKKTS